MTPEIALLCALPPEIERLLNARYLIHRFVPGPDRGDVRSIAAGVRGIVTGGAEGASAALLASLPQLEIVAVNGVGVDAVDIACACQRGIRVTNTPGVLTEDVADLAIGLLIATVRRLPAADSFLRAGKWKTGSFPLARKVSGKRLGILGLGRIGLAIARRAEAFGMSIAYTNRKPADVPYRFVASPLELAQQVDILVVAAAGGAQTRGLVNEEDH